MTDRSDTWMPLYVGDYLAATTRLNAEQHGAYLLLLLDYWRNGPPPDDDAVIAQITRLPIARWKKTRPAVIGFFEIRDGLLIQKRADRERTRAADITEKRRKAGEASAKARANAQQTPNKRPTHVGANDQQNGRQSQSHTPLDKSNGGSDPGKTLFDEGVRLLTSKGRTEGQARALIAKFQRDYGDPAVLDAINRSQSATDPVSAMRDRLGKSKAQAEYFGP